MIQKFRLFDKELKIIREVHLLDMYAGIIQCYVDDLKTNQQEVYEYDMYEIPPRYVLIQSTGLHDKNGKEIFEGDVIRIVHPFRGRTHIGEVFKDIYMFNIKDFYFSHYDSPGDAFSEGTEYMEIIGNIYQNPHLLKEDA